MIAIFKRQRKSVKIVIITLCILITASLGLWTVANAFINRKITRLLTEQLPIGAPGESYSASIGKIRGNWLKGCVIIENLEITNRHGSEDMPAADLELSAGRISLQGVNFNRRTKDLKIRSIEIEAPRIVYSGVPYIRKSVEGQSPAQKRPLSEMINSLELRSLSVEGADINIAHWSKTGSRNKLTADNLEFSLSMLSIDSPERMEPEDILKAVLLLSASRLSYTYNEGAMTAFAAGLSLDSGNGAFRADTLALLPQYPKNSYAQRVGGNSDWTEVILAEVRIAGLDTAQLSNGRVLSIDTLSIGSGSVASLKNRNVDAVKKVKKLAHEYIQSIPLPTTITTLSVRDLDISYDEIALGKQEPGNIVVSGLSADFEGFTNAAASKDQYIVMRASADFYHSGQGHFTATLSIPAHQDNDRFAMNGHISAVDAALFNRVMEQLMNARIDSGDIKGVDFDITGNSHNASIKMMVHYNGLSIALLDRKDQSKERSGLSALINAGLLFRDNPMKNRPPREGNGTAERDTYRSQFNYLYKILMSGIKDTVLRDKASILKD